MILKKVDIVTKDISESEDDCDNIDEDESSEDDAKHQPGSQNDLNNQMFCKGHWSKEEVCLYSNFSYFSNKGLRFHNILKIPYYLFIIKMENFIKSNRLIL